MTQRTATQKEAYLAASESFESNGASHDPAWARELRRDALDRFRELGFPTARRGNEEWKYTDVMPIARVPVRLGLTGTAAAIDPGAVERTSLGAPGWPQLVFVNGRYSEALSSVDALPDGVTAVSLAEAMRSTPDLVQPHLASFAGYQDNAFTALNTAFLHDGALVHVARGARVDDPIRLLFLSTGDGQETVAHPRVLIVAGEESSASVLEVYAGLSEGEHLTNAVTEVVVGAAARLDYYKVQRQSEQAYHITNTHVALERDSRFTSVNIDMGGRLTRNNLNLVTLDQDCSCLLTGFYLVTGRQHVDNQVIIDHAKPYTTSRELYKGILDGRSRSVFHGSIIVREGAVKVNAHQVDKNLLLSDQAEADTKPAFWIYCDDVKCGHGAACGHMDPMALFYLRSRGIDERMARGLLTRAFLSEVINGIGNETLRSQIDGLAADTLREWLGDIG